MLNQPDPGGGSYDPPPFYALNERNNAKYYGYQYTVALFIESRSQKLVGLTSHIQSAMSIILKRPLQESADPPSDEPPQKRRKCSVCVQQSHGVGHKSKKDLANKVKNQICGKCKRPVCTKHAVKTIICNNCE